MPTHQQHIVRVLSATLNLPEDTVTAWASRGNPFDKLLRSYDEFSADGVGLYMSPGTRNKKRLAAQLKHYRFSKDAYAAAMATGEAQYGEHKTPLKIIRQRLLNCDGTEAAIAEIMKDSEVVIITKDEQKHLDQTLKLSSSLPEGGLDRLSYAGIEIAPETAGNHL